jgi:hypothetical protein
MVLTCFHKDGSWLLIDSTYGCHNFTKPPEVNTTGLNKSFREKMKIYPNPTQGSFTVEFERDSKDCVFSISDIMGRTIQASFLMEGNRLLVNYEGAEGVYTLHITDRDGQESVHKLIRQ